METKGIHYNNYDYFSKSLLKHQLILLEVFNKKRYRNKLIENFQTPKLVRWNKEFEKYYKTFQAHQIHFLDTEIKYYTKGKGPRIVMTHAWGNNIYDLKTQIDLMVQMGFEVVAIDLPAHGLPTDPPQKTINLLNCGHILAQLLHHLNQEKSIKKIIAHSWGAMSIHLALDLLIEEGKDLAELSHVISVNMPICCTSIVKPFIHELELSNTGSELFIKDIKATYNTSSRNWDKLFPLGLQHLYQKECLFFNFQGDKDKNISYLDSIKFATKRNQFKLSIIPNTGHYDILKNAEFNKKLLSAIFESPIPILFKYLS